jgi:hypothetical protein
MWSILGGPAVHFAPQVELSSALPLNSSAKTGAQPAAPHSDSPGASSGAGGDGMVQLLGCCPLFPSVQPFRVWGNGGSQPTVLRGQPS